MYVLGWVSKWKYSTAAGNNPGIVAEWRYSGVPAVEPRLRADQAMIM